MQAVQPDGYFVIREGERQAHAFAQIDMSTTPCRRWAPKIKGLYQYRSSGKYTERSATKSVRVFRVTTSESRRTLLINSTEQEIPSIWQPLSWYAIRDEVNVESILAEPI
jgi:hypothetical protein